MLEIQYLLMILTWSQDEEKWLPADLKIKSEHIKDDSITDEKIQNNSITEKVTDYSIEGIKNFQDESITNEKEMTLARFLRKNRRWYNYLDQDISDSANIKRSKIEKDPSNPGHILVNDETGILSTLEVLDIERGGTGSNSVSGAQNNLGLKKPGRDIQKYSERLNELTQLKLKDNSLIGSDGTKITLKDSSEIRNILNLGKIQDIFVSDEGNVGIGTTMPSEKLEVNGNFNLRGNLFLNSNRITGLGAPEKDGDAVNKAWAERERAK